MKNSLIIALLILSNFTCGQSRIKQSKSELKESQKNTSTKDTNSDNSSCSDDSSYSESEGDGFAWLVIPFAITYYVLIGDYESEHHLSSNLTDYPYYNKRSGNYEKSDAVIADSLRTKMVFRFDAQYNYLHSGPELHGNHFKIKIRPNQYFYLQTDYNQIMEKNFATQITDNLSLFYFNFGYDRIRTEKFNLGWTMGASYVGSDVKKAGFSYGANFEFFPVNKVSILASAKWSHIQGNPVNMYELETKYHMKRSFISFGYRHLKIATPTYNFVTAGVGLYLN